MTKQTIESDVGAVCPYCGYIHKPDVRPEYWDSGEFICSNCSEVFSVSVHVTVIGEWITEKKP
jgi:uncharacterized Zn-finger protein